MTTASFLAAYTFDFGPVIEAFPKLLYGLWITIALAVVTMSISLPLGLATAFARLSSFRPLSGAAHAYVDLFRATPVLVQIFVIAFGIGPALGLKVDVFVLGAIALALNVGAFLSEIFRGAIQSIDRGQREAAIATGMTSRQAMRRVVLPQALRRCVPLVAAIWVSLFKDTSLLALVGVGELYLQGYLVMLDSFRQVETMAVVALIYFVVTYPQSLFIERLFQRYRVRD
jgi:His/Glu/Gln/Arg/opine family amino acid ABC transporter permease subunit